MAPTKRQNRDHSGSQKKAKSAATKTGPSQSRGRRKPRLVEKLSSREDTAKSIQSRIEEKQLKPSPALEAVFNTVELLENILAQLDFGSVITSQHVSSLFRNTTSNSKKLKQKLFLYPQEPHEQWAIVGHTITDLHFIRLTPTTVLPIRVPPLTHDGWKFQRPPSKLHPVHLNPLLKLEDLWWKTRLLEPEDRDIVSRLATFYPEYEYELQHDLHGYSSGASWRNMHLCNPPCTEVHATVTFEVSRVPLRSASVCVHVKEASGITFGLLVDRAMVAPLMSKDGKKCGGRHGPAGAYVRELEELHGRAAFVKAKTAVSVSEGTTIRMQGVVAPSEKEWTDVILAAERRS